MLFNLSERDFKRFREAVARDEKFSIKRRATFKTMSELQNLPCAACVICGNTGEELWAKVVEFQWMGDNHIRCFLKGE